MRMRIRAALLCRCPGTGNCAAAAAVFSPDCGFQHHLQTPAPSAKAPQGQKQCTVVLAVSSAAAPTLVAALHTRLLRP